MALTIPVVSVMGYGIQLMINPQAASIFGELLDSIVSIIFRVFIKSAGCQTECSDSGFGRALIIIVLVTIFLAIYIYAAKKHKKTKSRPNQRAQ